MQLVKNLAKEVMGSVVSDFDYYREKPAHLAWAMMNYELICRVGGCSSNPEDAISEITEQVSKEDAKLVYDAWYAGVSHYDEFPDTNPNFSLEGKIDKTMKEWVNVLTDKRHRYHKLFRDEFSVKNYLLCVIGTSYGWTEKGFIAHLGPYGTDTTIFSGYTRAEQEIPEEVRNKIIRLRDDELIGRETNKYLRETQEKAQRIYSGEHWLSVLKGEDLVSEKLMREIKAEIQRIERDLGIDISEFPSFKTLPSKKRTHYPVCEYANLVTMPANAHQSYIDTGLEIAEEIINNPKEPEEARRYAIGFLEERRLDNCLLHL